MSGRTAPLSDMPLDQIGFALQTSPVLLGTLASAAAGLATGAGALPVFLLARPGERGQHFMLGFAAGIMLAASFFSLIIPGLEAARVQFADPLAAVFVVIAGILAGAGFLWLLDRLVPHIALTGSRGVTADARATRVWLFIIAITLHNLPEGLAVGVGFGGGNIGHGVALTIGIGLQNMPEGLAVALALLTLRYSRVRAVLLATLTGMVEPLGGVLGAGVVTLAHSLLPWGLAFAAGAMLFVVTDDIIPEIQPPIGDGRGTVGLMLGLVVMLFLDVVLG